MYVFNIHFGVVLNGIEFGSSKPDLTFNVIVGRSFSFYFCSFKTKEMNCCQTGSGIKVCDALLVFPLL